MSDENGEVRDTAEPEETALDHPEPSEDAETEFRPFDEVEEDFNPGPAQYQVGGDGLPITVDLTTESDIPALSTTSLVCMGDYSKFVLRDRWGEVIATIEAADVNRAPDGRWRAKADVVVKRAEFWVAALKQKLATLKKEVPDVQFAESDNPLALLLSARADPGELVEYELEWVEVEPIRPPCKHYVRQQGSFHLNAANKKYYRLCSARRTTEGTFMTVSDTGMWACDMRDPYDVESTKVLDDFDKLKIDQGAKRQHLPMLGGGNGVFDPPPRTGLGKEVSDA